MIKDLQKLMEDIRAQFRQFVPSDVCNTIQDNIQSFGESSLSKMNVVSRSEYDSQNKALDDIAAKIEQISQKIEVLEKK